MHIAKKQNKKKTKTLMKQTKTRISNNSTSGDDLLDIKKLLQK
jgi:hypothetical protein